MSRTPAGTGARRVDFVALEYALLVNEHRSIRRAADVLAVPPSTVSRRVRALEDDLHVSLFNRSVRGVEPTVAGERLLARACDILNEVDLLLRNASSYGEGREGRLRLGIVASLAAGGGHDLVRSFTRSHPDARLEVIEGSPREHIAGIRSRRLDVAFVVGMPPSTECELEPLWTEPILVALPIAHRLSANKEIDWSELLEETFIVSEVDPGPEIHDFIVSKLSRLGHQPRIHPVAVQRESLMVLVGLGQGVSLVSGAEAGVSYPGVLFLPLSGENLPFAVVWSEQNDNPILRRFMSLARRWSRERKIASDAPARTPDRSP